MSDQIVLQVLTESTVISSAPTVAAAGATHDVPSSSTVSSTTSTGKHDGEHGTNRQLFSIASPPPVRFPKPPPGFIMQTSPPPPPPPASSSSIPQQPNSAISSSSSSFHPDFLFCGTCTDCQVEVDGDRGASSFASSDYRTSSSLDTDDSLDNADDDFTDMDPERRRTRRRRQQQTTLQLRNPKSTPGRSSYTTNNGSNHNNSRSSTPLIIKSILRPIPGVHNVTILNHSTSKEKSSVTNQTDDSSNYNNSHHINDTVVIDHDASAHAQQFLTVLENAGYPAIVIMDDRETMAMSSTSNNHSSNNTDGKITDEGGSFDNNEEVWVRSQFYVQGVCCASEIPSLRQILHKRNLGPGVGKLNVNLTTKVVHVQHNIKSLSAGQIASELTRQGFPTQIRKDGGAMAVLARSTADQFSTVGRSTFHIEGGLSTRREVSMIHNILANVHGISKVGVNFEEGVVYADHDTSIVSSTAIAEILSSGGKGKVDISTGRSIADINHNENQKVANGNGSEFPRFVCTVAFAAEHSSGNAAAAALDQIGRSRYVESTIMFDGLQAYQVPLIEKALKRNFIRAQLRAIYPSVLSETIKVEHDPKMASIDDICSVLNDPLHNSSFSALTATIVVDGADSNLYLPLQEDYGENKVKHEGEPSLMTIHANVWLSGVFWALSLVGFSQGREWFKYFGLLSVVFGLPPIALKAWRTLIRRQFDANCMMVTAATGALVLGEFDEAASVAFLFAISEFLEARATMKARKALSLICALRPDHANVIHPTTKEIIVVPADRVPLGSLISVRTGDKIVADGIIVEGTSAVDESSLTGESTPAHKKIGDSVSGGTINIGQTQLVVKTTTTVDDSAVSRLIRLVEEAQSNRSPTEKMIDGFARSYTPGVMSLAALMCTIPWIFGGEVGRYWTLNGLIIVVIACPCALTISTPVTYAAGLAATAQQGIIIKGGAKLEAMGSVDRVVFDKTGTLTKGDFSVTRLEVVGNSRTRTEMLQILSLMQERASHPIALSLVQAVKEEGIDVPRHASVTDHQVLKGEGVTAKIEGHQVFVGNKRLFSRLKMFQSLSDENVELSRQLLETGGTVGFIGTNDDGIIGIFCVKDVVRDDARVVVDALKELRIDTLICTGDSDQAAQAVAKEIGIPPGAVNSQLFPEDKLHFVGSLKRPQPKTCSVFRQKRYVLFCGDGINDAPALAVADVGVSMGEGAAMALEMSDVTLMDSSLTKLVFAIEMGRRVLRTVKENIIISLLAKVAVVVLTFAGKMTLLYAIAADVGIMLLVTLNGMKLLPSSTIVHVTRLRRRNGKSSFGVSSKKNVGDGFELIGSAKLFNHYDDATEQSKDGLMEDAEIV